MCYPYIPGEESFRVGELDWEGAANRIQDLKMVIRKVVIRVKRGWVSEGEIPSLEEAVNYSRLFMPNVNLDERERVFNERMEKAAAKLGVFPDEGLQIEGKLIPWKEALKIVGDALVQLLEESIKKYGNPSSEHCDSEKEHFYQLRLNSSKQHIAELTPRA